MPDNKRFTEADVTDDWIKCSMTAGYLATVLEQYSGSSAFIEACRELALDINWSVVEKMRESARIIGVPQQELELPPDIQRRLDDPEFLIFARNYQISVLRAIRAREN